MSDSKNKIFISTDCIPEQTLFDYIDNKLSAKENNAVEKHLLDCELCSDALEGLKLVKDRTRIRVINQKVKEFIAPGHDKKVVTINYRLITAIAAGLALLIGSVFFFQQFTSNSMMEQKSVADIKKIPSEPLPAITEEILTDSVVNETSLKTEPKAPALANQLKQQPPPPTFSEPSPTPASPASGVSAPATEQIITSPVLKEENIRKALEEINNKKRDASIDDDNAKPAPSIFQKITERQSKEDPHKNDLDEKTDSKFAKRKEKSAAYETTTSEGSRDKEYASNEVLLSDANDSVHMVDENPEFPGGYTEMEKFISANLKYPKQYAEGSVTGTVYAQFIVTKEGKLIQLKIVKGIDCCPEFNAEVIRIIKMMPEWKPGKQHGEAVSAQYNLPVKFGIK
jgi:protein TonB